jgi:hypothetical protein
MPRERHRSCAQHAGSAGPTPTPPRGVRAQQLKVKQVQDQVWIFSAGPARGERVQPAGPAAGICSGSGSAALQHPAARRALRGQRAAAAAVQTLVLDSFRCRPGVWQARGARLQPAALAAGRCSTPDTPLHLQRGAAAHPTPASVAGPAGGPLQQRGSCCGCLSACRWASGPLQLSGTGLLCGCALPAASPHPCIWLTWGCTDEVQVSCSGQVQCVQCRVCVCVCVCVCAGVCVCVCVCRAPQAGALSFRTELTQVGLGC